VGRLGLEPRTHGLKVRCSTIELTPRGTVDRRRLRTKRTESVTWRGPEHHFYRVSPVTSRFVHASFFEPAGPGRFVATTATAGPWSPDAQHGGPPSALAARELEQHEPDGNLRLARVAVDILGPVPVGLLTARTRTLRPGKRVALLETVLESGGRPVLVARGWRIAKLADAPVVTRTAVTPEVPATVKAPRFPGGHVDGYLSHIEWRFEAGNFDEPGPCTTWARPRIPLLPGEEISPMARTLLLADSGSGISMTLDPIAYIFINVDLTVILHRDPAGEWLLLDAVTTMDGTGTGLAETRLSDAAGEVGAGVQTLLVSPR
jgi:Thioesterase-like superfamily